MTERLKNLPIGSVQIKVKPLLLFAGHYSLSIVYRSLFTIDIASFSRMVAFWS